MYRRCNSSAELGYEEFNCTGGQIVHVNLINFRISCGEVSLQHIIQFFGWETSLPLASVIDSQLAPFLPLYKLNIFIKLSGTADFCLTVGDWSVLITMVEGCLASISQTIRLVLYAEAMGKQI